MKIVSLNEKFCLVRILHCLQNVTLPYMSHIIGVLNCRLQNKAYCKTVKTDRLSSVRWKDTPLVDFTDGVILASYRCIEEDNFDCKLASLRFCCEFC